MLTEFWIGLYLQNIFGCNDGCVTHHLPPVRWGVPADCRSWQAVDRLCCISSSLSLFSKPEMLPGKRNKTGRRKMKKNASQAAGKNRPLPCVFNILRPRTLPRRKKSRNGHALFFQTPCVPRSVVHRRAYDLRPSGAYSPCSTGNHIWDWEVFYFW